ncbi:cytochrome c3 family protein, partial [Trichloromonas sp.]|uniref:cytochrome c3 family protein n=1 Tax=Trichloromonas sp. TaxID=3069249 RepID=UPI003D815235
MKVYVVLTDLNCTNCHDGANHESSHDMAFFSPEPAASQLCMSCHQQMVAEHLSRELSCTTCHNNTDPKIMDTIYRGQNGEAVYCLDCHYQVQLSYGIHNAAHDTACVGCHILPKDEKGLTL